MTVLWSSLAIGAVYALVAIGYNITYVWAGVLNFAHSQFIVIGAFIAYWGLVDQEWPVIVVIVLAAVICGLLGLIEERIGFRPLAGAAGHMELVISIGSATVLMGMLFVLWGPDPLKVPFILPTEVFSIWGGRVSTVSLALVALAIVSGLGIHVWSRWAQVGLAGLARSEDLEAAQLRGVNTVRMSAAAFAAAGAFGGLVGAVVVGPKTFAVAALGFPLAIKGFVALVLGGVGRQDGAVVGGLLVGVAEGMAAWRVGQEFSQLIVFALFLGVLLLKPTGLFGDRELRVV